MLNSIAVYFVLCIILAVQTVFIAVSCGKFRDEWWWRGWHLDGGSRGIQADQVWRPSSSRGSSLIMQCFWLLTFDTLQLIDGKRTSKTKGGCSKILVCTEQYLYHKNQNAVSWPKSQLIEIDIWNVWSLIFYQYRGVFSGFLARFLGHIINSSFWTYAPHWPVTFNTTI